jgi:hypothetical protein
VIGKRSIPPSRPALDVRSFGLGAALFGVGILLIGLVFDRLPASDWSGQIQPGVQTLLSGHNPYSQPNFFIAPWGALLLAPFAVLPGNLGRDMLAVIGLLAYLAIARRMGAKPPAMIAVALSPLVLQELVYGNIDWLALTGLLLPPQLGLFLVVLKPQVGAGVACFWMVEAIRGKCLLRTFLPIAVTTGVSLMLYGWWPLHMLAVPSQFNDSLWPFSLPAGLVLLYFALTRRNERSALAAAPCLSPHVIFHSWVVGLLALTTNNDLTIVDSIGTWLLIFTLAFQGKLHW